MYGATDVPVPLRGVAAEFLDPDRLQLSLGFPKGGHFGSGISPRTDRSSHTNSVDAQRHAVPLFTGYGEHQSKESRWPRADLATPARLGATDVPPMTRATCGLNAYPKRSYLVLTCAWPGEHGLARNTRMVERNTFRYPWLVGPGGPGAAP